MSAEIWTLTVDDQAGTWTTVHRSEEDAIVWLGDNYDATEELRERANGDVVEGVTSYGGICVYIDSHVLPWLS